jgi:lysophospholipase L1-like esterase
MKAMRTSLRVATTLAASLLVGVFACQTAGAAITSNAGTCTEPSGQAYRVTYTYNSDNGIAQVTDMQIRSSASQPWSTFNDFWGLVSKLEYWTPNTFQQLFLDPPSGSYASPAITLALDMNGYNSWWGAADQRPAILGASVYTFLQPRVEFRSTGDPLDRKADSCDIYLNGYSAGSGSAPKKVAHVGDSISDQMAPELNRRNNLAGRKYFIDPQSGQSYASMIGELRGIAGGLRSGSTTVKPDILVMALGTNDVGGALYASDFNAWKTGLGWTLARALIDTAAVQCRVVMTVRDMGRDPGYENTRLADAADEYNSQITTAVNNDPTHMKLVNWNSLAATHRPNSAVPWFTTADRTHPNVAGLNALTSEILAKTGTC